MSKPLALGIGLSVLSRNADLLDKSISERELLLKAEFEQLKDWEARYEHLINIGKNSKGLSDLQKTDDLKIQGCQSQVWLKAELNKEGKIIFTADSDALITKGLVTLLINYFSGLTPDEVIAAQPKFIEDIGLKNHLSPSRANGLMAMVKQIKFYGMAYKIKMR